MQTPGQNALQPVQPFPSTVAAELTEVTAGLQKRFLNEIGGVRPRLQMGIDPRASEHAQVRPMALQERAQAIEVTSARFGQKSLGIWLD
jgi:hypothetical protein